MHTVLYIHLPNPVLDLHLLYSLTEFHIPHYVLTGAPPSSTCTKTLPPPSSTEPSSTPTCTRTSPPPPCTWPPILSPCTRTVPPTPYFNSTSFTLYLTSTSSSLPWSCTSLPRPRVKGGSSHRRDSTMAVSSHWTEHSRHYWHSSLADTGENSADNTGTHH